MFKRLQLVVTSRPVDPDAGSSQFCRFMSDKWSEAKLPEHKQQRQIPCAVFSEDKDPQTTTRRTGTRDPKQSTRGAGVIASYLHRPKKV